MAKKISIEGIGKPSEVKIHDEDNQEIPFDRLALFIIPANDCTVAEITKDGVTESRHVMNVSVIHELHNELPEEKPVEKKSKK